MSTTSRNCRTDGGPRAGNPDEVSVPGVNGKTRGHYDPRAARQLGSVKNTEPKRWPLALKAAPLPPRVWAKATLQGGEGPSRALVPPLSSCLVSGRHDRPLRHSPPLYFPEAAMT